MAFDWLTDFHTADFSSLWRGMATVARRGLVSVFWQVLAGHSFWRGDWALDYHSMGFRQFPDIS